MLIFNWTEIEQTESSLRFRKSAAISSSFPMRMQLSLHRNMNRAMHEELKKHFVRRETNYDVSPNTTAVDNSLSKYVFIE